MATVTIHKGATRTVETVPDPEPSEAPAPAPKRPRD